MQDLSLAGISVYIERDVHDIYEKLTSRSSQQAEDRPFATMKDLFMLAACAGAQRNRFKELGPSRDIFSGETFDNQTDVPVLAALAYYRTKDLEVLTDPKRVIEIAQEWANAGIQIVYDELVGRPGIPLHNLVDMLLPHEAEKGSG